MLSNDEKAKERFFLPQKLPEIWHHQVEINCQNIFNINSSIEKIMKPWNSSFSLFVASSYSALVFIAPVKTFKNLLKWKSTSEILIRNRDRQRDFLSFPATCESAKRRKNNIQPHRVELFGEWNNCDIRDSKRELRRHSLRRHFFHGNGTLRGSEKFFIVLLLKPFE